MSTLIKRSRLQKRKAWYETTYVNLLILPILALLCFQSKLLYYEMVKTVSAQIILPIPAKEQVIEHPFILDYYNLLIPTTSPTALPTPAPTKGPESNPDYQEIKDEVIRVFGSNADKAFLLLSCENSTWNTQAINTAGNYPEGSRDSGLFQINEYWQAVQIKYLLNYKINILIAKQLFDENNEQFNLWTCGRRLGI